MDAAPQLVTRLAVLCIAVVLLSGCVQRGSSSPEDEEAPRPPSFALPTAMQLRPAADQEARAGNPEARLIFVSTFEGMLPESTSGGRMNPWIAPYYDGNEAMADGRAALWSFSYAVDDTVGRTATALCETGVHSEVRQAHVVTLDANGTVVASYETMNDDEGAPMTGYIPGGLMDSGTAAEHAHRQTDLARKVTQADWTQTWLMADWYASQPLWVFMVYLPEARYFVAVDAATGEVVHEGDPLAPRC